MKTENIKLIENDEIEVYGSDKYNKEFLERLVSYYIKSKNKILSFFGIGEFRKIRVNLYESKQCYDDCFKDIMKISKYGIGNCYMGEINYVCTKEDLATIPRAGFVIASIVHEFVHLVYYEKVTKNKCVWIEEGLAQYLSGQKSLLEMDDQRYNSWLKDNIFSKEIPKIEYLKEHGSKYGMFCDMETNKYNGYDMSYALIRFMTYKYTNKEINEIIREESRLRECEKIIIQDFIEATKESAE